MTPYFIWKGTDSRTMGVTLISIPPVIRGEERVTHVTIPGRSGDLTIVEGDKVFQSYIQTLSIGFRIDDTQYSAGDIVNWLTGSGALTLCLQPNLEQQARVIGAVTLSKLSHGMTWATGEVQFYCDPLKKATGAEQKTVYTEAGNIVNGGDV